MSFTRLMSRSLMLGLGMFMFAVIAAHGQAPDDKATSPTKKLAPDTVLVLVNGKSITQKDVDDYVSNMINMQLRRMGPNGQLRPEDIRNLRGMIEADARGKLIDAKLLEQAVEPFMSKVTDKEIKARLEEIKKLYAKEGQDFEKLLARQRIPASEMNAKIRQQIAATRFIESSEGSMSPTEKEIREFIKEHKDRLDRPEEIRTSHILIGTKDVESTATAKAKADQVRKDVMANPKDWDKFAAKYSDDPGSKDQGGDVGFINREAPFVEQYKDAAFALKKVGDVSPVTESQFGFHIIKLTDKKAAQPATFESVGEEVKMIIESQKMMQATQPAIDKLRAKAKIEVKVPETKPAPMMMDGDKASTSTMPRMRPRPGQRPRGARTPGNAPSAK